jgi:hypothetical protein
MTLAAGAQDLLDRLSRLNITPQRDVLLSELTRFAIGGPADFYIETAEPAIFAQALAIVRRSGLRWVVIGGGDQQPHRGGGPSG